ncbi:siderophore iron transporter ARN1 [Kluyveromyces marxianus]|nr:siderophore iron transporter ARN1 [Kluyveromyces marxianus]
MTSSDNGDIAFKDKGNNVIIDEKHVEKDSFKSSKSIVIRKTEILAEQYSSWQWRFVLLLSAFLCGYGYGLDSTLRSFYTTYATNSYSTHSLLSTVGVINAVMGAAAQIVYARLSDVYGRFTLFCTAIMFYVVGTIIESQAYDVQRYAAGAVFYNIGYVGVILIVLLILSDFSSLRWRLFYSFVPAWPFIINTWISGDIVASVKPQKHWSWAIAMWAFIFPLSCLPLITCMIHMRMRARKTAAWKELSQEQTFYQKHGLKSTLVELFWKLDVVGVILMIVILGCILVPLTLAGGTSSKWRQAHIIAPFVVGFVLIPFFIVWESRFAVEPVAPFKLLKDRGIWAALAISFLVNFIFTMAAGYLFTILIVAVDQSNKAATRITSISTFTSTVFSPFFALFVTRITRLKPYIILGCSLWMVAMGILFHFRSGQHSDNGIIGALVVWGIGTTMFTYPVTVSIQSVTSHEHMATVTALSYTMYRIGSAVGSSVSGAIWTQLLYKQLLKHLGGDAELAAKFYGAPLTYVALYPWDSPIRQSVVQAYRYVQKYEVLVALVFTVPLFVLSLCLRDPPLTDSVAHENIKEGEYIDVEHDDPVSNWISSKWNRLTK